jgi:hypothetical protein
MTIQQELKKQQYAALKPLKSKTVKPQRSIAVLASAPAGIHPPYAPSYTRRVRP